MVASTIQAFDYSDLNIDIENVNSLQLLSKPSSLSWILLGTILEGMVNYHQTNFEIAENFSLLNLIHKLEIIPNIIMSPAFLNMRSHIWDHFYKLLCQKETKEFELNHNSIIESINFKNGEYERHFQEISVIGKGGFGQVYKASHYLDKQIYAIKKIKLTSFMQTYSMNVNSINKTIEKTLREVNLLSSCNHQNVVRYYNSWIETEIFHQPSHVYKNNHISTNMSNITESLPKEDPSNAIECDNLKVSLMIQMHYYPDSLRSFMCSRNCKKMLDKYQLQLAHQLYLNILSGLLYLHDVVMIIHRDIKPENIFLDINSYPITAVIGDFGLAIKFNCFDKYKSSCHKFCEDDKLQDITHGLGTNLYAAPEQLIFSNNLYDYKVDIYSLGMVAFELFNFFATDSERIRSLHNLRISNNITADFMNQLPLHANQVMQCCQIDPQQRPNAHQLIDDISKWQGC